MIKKLGYTQNMYALLLLIGLLNTCSDCHNRYYQKQDGAKKLTTIRFAQYIRTVQRKRKDNHKLTLSLMPAWKNCKFSGSHGGI